MDNSIIIQCILDWYYIYILNMTKVDNAVIGEADAGQRLDNFLFKKMKGVPRARVYRAVRGGEVRVDGARKDFSYKLQLGDLVRIPPLRYNAKSSQIDSAAAKEQRARLIILYEDQDLLVINKPAGLAVHGGTKIKFGLIELLKNADYDFLELGHRLDRDTSGCLLLAKSRAGLLKLHAQIKQRRMTKQYSAVVAGRWRGGRREVDSDLAVKQNMLDKKTAKSITAKSIFTPIVSNNECALVDIQLVTGRTHQARLHSAALGQPIIGDKLYGDADSARLAAAAGLKRMFLHASKLRLQHPINNEPLEIVAPLPIELTTALNRLNLKNVFN